MACSSTTSTPHLCVPTRKCWPFIANFRDLRQDEFAYTRGLAVRGIWRHKGNEGEETEDRQYARQEGAVPIFLFGRREAGRRSRSRRRSHQRWLKR